MQEQTESSWTKRLSVALTVSIAAFGAWAWLTHFGLLPRALAAPAGGMLMAGLCLTAQGLANAHAANGRFFSARGDRNLVRLCVAKVIFFGGVSAFGVHHGYEIVKAVAPSLGVTPLPDVIALPLLMGLALFEPANFLVVEARREWERNAPPTRRVEAEARSGLTMAAGAAAALAVVAQSPAVHVTQPEGGMQIAAGGGAAQGRAQADGAVTRHSDTATKSAARRAKLKAEAMLLLRQGALSHRAIAAVVGLSPRTVDRLALAMAREA